MSDRQISARLAQIDAELSPLEEAMERLGSKSALYLQGVPWAAKADHERYVTARDRYQGLKSERGGLVAEQGRRSPAARKNQSRTFVNSFGEATNRYVTTATYERAMKRTEKEIMARMKGFR